VTRYICEKHHFYQRGSEQKKPIARPIPPIAIQSRYELAVMATKAWVVLSREATMGATEPPRSNKQRNRMSTNIYLPYHFHYTQRPCKGTDVALNSVTVSHMPRPTHHLKHIHSSHKFHRRMSIEDGRSTAQTLRRSQAVRSCKFSSVLERGRSIRGDITSRPYRCCVCAAHACTRSQYS
jgi:hypothetical protein